MTKQIKRAAKSVDKLKLKVFNLGNNLANRVVNGYLVEDDTFLTREQMPERYAFGTCKLRSVNIRSACNRFALEIRGDEHMHVLTIVQMMTVEADEKESDF